MTPKKELTADDLTALSELTIEDLARSTELLVTTYPHHTAAWVYLLLAVERPRRSIMRHTMPADDVQERIATLSPTAQAVITEFRAMEQALHDPEQYLQHWIDELARDLAFVDEFVETSESAAINDAGSRMASMAKVFLNSVAEFRKAVVAHCSGVS